MSTRTRYSNWRTDAYRWCWAGVTCALAVVAFNPSIADERGGGGGGGRGGGGGGGGGAHVGGGGGGGAHYGGGGVQYGGGGGVRMAAPSAGVRMAAPSAGVRMAAPAPAVRAPAINSGATVHAPAATSNFSARAPGVTAGTGINAGAAAGAHTALRPTFGPTATTAGTGVNATNNFRANWHTATPTQLQGVHTNLSSALATRNAATANTAATATARATAPTVTGTTTPTVSATGGTTAGINPNRAAYWAGYGAAVRNSYLGGYGGLGAYGGLGYAPFYGGNFWSGRNLIGLGLMSALGGGYGGYGLGGYGLGGYGGYGLGGLGGYGGLGNWWGYSPWLGTQPYGYWYGNTGWNNLASGYGWQQPYYYDYGPNGNVAYQGNQVVVNGTPVGTSADYAQSAAQLATVTPEEMNAPHDWMPLGTFSVATSTNDPKPVRVAQLAYDNKQGLISGTIFNQQSNNLYTLQGKVDPQTQRVAFTVGNDPNTVMETGLYNLTQNETPVLVHFGPEQTATYLFARLPEPKEAPQTQTATAPGPAPQGAPPAEDLRR
jgi:hypothetical protein